jgi:hypothetical protein
MKMNTRLMYNTERAWKLKDIRITCVVAITSKLYTTCWIHQASW